MTNEQYKLETSANGNVIYINYKLLSEIEFDGKPVVPSILSELQEGQEIGLISMEKIQGIEFLEVINDSKVTVVKKLELLLHAVRQLITIDESGFIVFDRHAGNMMVESLSPISMRQVDLEDLYDKKHDCKYSLSNNDHTHEIIDDYNTRGISLWNSAVRDLLHIGASIGEYSNDNELEMSFLSMSRKRNLEYPTLTELEIFLQGWIDFLATPLKV